MYLMKNQVVFFRMKELLLLILFVCVLYTFPMISFFILGRPLAFQVNMVSIRFWTITVGSVIVCYSLVVISILNFIKRMSLFKERLHEMAYLLSVSYNHTGSAE